MSTFLSYAISGLGPGAILGLLGVGLVVTFRGAGVVNLSHGAFAMVTAYLFWELRQMHGWALLPAFLVAIASITLLGIASDQLILRLLRRASGLTRFIATLGLLLLFQSLVQRIWGSDVHVANAVISAHALHIGAVTVPSDRLWLLAIAIALTAAFTVAWRYTRFGWIAEAVSENETLAATLGWSPSLVSALTWAAGGALAGLAGILIAPITELSTVSMPLLVVPALAAALVGGFRSFPITLLGALAIGVGQSLILGYVNIQGASDALPFLVIAFCLAVRGTGLPIRGFAAERLPRIGTGRIRWTFVLPCSIAAVVGLSFITSDNWLAALTATFGAAIILLSFVVLIGYSGQISLAQWTLAGLGALIAAKLVTSTGLPFWVSLIAGAVSAGLIGLVFALPALRTRGVNLAVVTLGLGLATQSIIFDAGSLTGGIQGILVPSPNLFGWSIDPIIHPGRYAVFAFVTFVLLALIVAKVRTSAAGRTMLAIRGNERAAASNGISVLIGKLLAFGLAGVIAGIGGIVLAFQQSDLSFQGYDPISSITFLANSVIGGIGFLFGPLFGASLSPSSFGSIIALHWAAIDNWLPLFSAAALLITLILNPNGWVYEALKPFAKLDRRRRSRAQLAEAETGPAAVTSPRETIHVRARPVRPSSTLSVRGIGVRYGRVIAVDNLSLTVRPGEIVGLIGPNGAGKTSLMDAITGFAHAAEGSVLLGSTDITKWNPHRRARNGLVRSFQSLELYPDMTVRENLLTATEAHGILATIRNVFKLHSAELSPSTAAIVRELHLEPSLDRLPEELSYGQRRLLAIARAVAMEPSILLVDEPVAGLEQVETTEIGGLLKSLARERSIGVLVVEHDMPFVMSICDHIHVVDFGKQVTEGSPDVVRDDPAAITAYLGEESTDHTEAQSGVL